MKDYKEMADSVLGRVHEFEQQKQSSRARVKVVGRTAAIVVPVLAIAAVSVFALNAGFGKGDISTSDGEADTAASESVLAAGIKEDSADARSSETGVFAGNYWVVNSEKGNNSSEAASSSSSEASETSRAESSAPQSATTTADSSVPDGGYGGLPNIACIPDSNTKQYLGEKISREEAVKYFTEHAKSLESSLSASGVKLVSYDTESKTTNSIVYSDGTILVRDGYCHVSYYGKPGEGLTIKQNFMDFPVFSGGKLIAIVTLVKENGAISGTPAFGAPWFGDFQDLMYKYSGQKLLFIYAGAMEFVITPDGKVFNPQGLQSAVNDSGLNKKSDAYNWFLDEQCLYKCFVEDPQQLQMND